MRPILFFLPLLCILFASAASPFQAEGRERGPSGLLLPRFVSIAANKVNLRTGPGVRYPVAWVFVRKGLPILVTEEFEYWRKVRDFDGVEGWIHKSLLTGRRAAIVVGDVRTLRASPQPDSQAVARAEPGVIGRLVACIERWCRLELSEFTGWIPRQHIFGTLKGETFD